MVSAEHRTALYVAIPAYFLILILSAVWAYRREQRLESSSIGADHLSAHYLGGRSFGPIVTAGTIFASVFSGYTVIGIPNEAFNTGFFSIRWLVGIVGMVGIYAGTSLRLRKASMLRNHASPADFITDRYQSQVLRYTTVLLQLVPAIIYLAAQVGALKNTFNGIFDIDLDNPWPVICLFFVILFFEWAGGLSSVAMTDCIQGFIMILSFLCMSAILKRNFGGWSTFTVANFPEPKLLQTPSMDQQWKSWQFTLLTMGFFTLPHFIQRIYAARDLKSLKTGFSFMLFGSWLAMLSSIFLGTMGIVMLRDKEDVSASPFNDILEAVMDLGGFAKGIGSIIWVATIAAIMSTADSLIIAISQLVTTEILYPMRPQAPPSHLVYYGRVVSLLTVIIALIIGLAWKEGITELAAIQFALSMMCVPIFYFGLYAKNDVCDCHPWSLAAASLTGFVYVLVTYFAYVSKYSDAAPIDVGLTGLLLNVFLLFIIETVRCLFKLSKKQENAASKTEASESRLLFPNRPTWDVPKLERFGDHTLTPALLNKAMEGMRDPMSNFYYPVLLILSMTACTPFTPEFQPPLDPSTNTFYNNMLPVMINGLPWWAFKSLILTVIPYLLVSGFLWQIPSDYPKIEEVLQPAVTEIKPNQLVELKMEEMIRRSSYDERNASFIKRRRHTVTDLKTSMTLANQDFGRYLDDVSSDDMEENASA